jgi:hypothetical protein
LASASLPGFASRFARLLGALRSSELEPS